MRLYFSIINKMAQVALLLTMNLENSTNCSPTKAALYRLNSAAKGLECCSYSYGLSANTI